LTPGELAASHVVDWEEVIAHELVNCIAEVVATGAALMFAQSQDGGVLRLQILDGGEKPKWYVRDADELNQILREVGALAASINRADVRPSET
jgi:hypothetical protein